MIYSSVLSAVVSALAAESIDNTSKQAWQKLYDPNDEEGAGIESLNRASGAEDIDRNMVDCLVFAILHRRLSGGCPVRPRRYSARGHFYCITYTAGARRSSCSAGAGGKGRS